MKVHRWVGLLLGLVTVLLIVLPTVAQSKLPLNTLFQTSTLSALMAGVYEGSTTFSDLKQHGNFGLGTVNGLDGEMIGLDGQFYQIKADGIARQLGDRQQTPFAAITAFKAEQKVTLSEPLNYVQLQQALDQQLPTLNIPYALLIQGSFPSLKVRSVSRQTPPYRPLTEALKEQVVFDLQSVKGTLVGYRIPKYMQGINAAGYHLHFIDQRRKLGGHLMEGQFLNTTVELQALRKLELKLPRSTSFDQADLGDGSPAAVSR